VEIDPQDDSDGSISEYGTKPGPARENTFQVSEFFWCSSDDDASVTSSDEDSESERDFVWDLDASPSVPPVDDSKVLKEKLAHWALKHNVTHTALDELLTMLRQHGHESLPRRATTLLGTVHSISKDLIKMGGGSYWYRGIKKYLDTYFKPET